MQNKENTMSELIQGGYSLYGIPLGIIMLDCKFPRPPGDIGNAASFAFPVHYEILRGVDPQALIQDREKQAVETLLQSARKLEELGVKAIITSCGLLIHYQNLLAEAVNIPVASSALLLLPFLGALLPPDRKIGVLCAKAAVLTPERLAHVMPEQADRVMIKGMEGCEQFDRVIMNQTPPLELDPQDICDETLAVVKQFMAEELSLGALLLECTNLAPYSTAIRKRFNIPVFDILHLATLLCSGTTDH
jgi:Asp/Glu/hydantoin racemase